MSRVRFLTRLRGFVGVAVSAWPAASAWPAVSVKALRLLLRSALRLHPLIVDY